MRLTAEEKAICKEYGKRGEDGRVRCRECPLVIDRRDMVCKRNISKKNAKEYYDYQKGAPND